MAGTHTAADRRSSKPAPPIVGVDAGRASTAPLHSEPGSPAALPASGHRRVVIESIRPEVDGGVYPAKAAVGDTVDVSADVFADGHDVVGCELRYKHAEERAWVTVLLRALPDDRWQGGFPVSRLGRYQFALRADVDRWGSWRRDVEIRAGLSQDISTELIVGADLVSAAAERAGRHDRGLLESVARQLRSAPRGLETEVIVDVPLDHGGTVAGLVADERLAELMWSCRDARGTVTSARRDVVVDPVRARFSTWYEFFPRSTAPKAGRHGRLADAAARLDYVAALGADIAYLPPIHPIGITNRKGRDGSPVARPSDPGSPWAIGSAEGGHTSLHPELGTIEDFDALVAAAADRGIEIALDLALQCSPDHPWVEEHPDWFRHRPDGSIRFAENPPKRYEDIYPIDFETDDWEALWQAVLQVVTFWIGHGVRVFRVDNPHTKPFALWEWLIGTVKADHPEVIFLAEAFTRPTVMNRLAKIGFSQSYTYFTWRTTKWELESYLHELTRTPTADFFRPNFWPNTPDILAAPLQTGLTSAFLARLVLAATLAANYGIYGPPFELREHQSREPGSEEYKDSEKYAIRHWDLDRPDSLAAFIGRINRIRHDHPALQHNHTLRFHGVDNDQLIAYSKSHLVESPQHLGQSPAHHPREPDVILVVVNLDPAHPQSGWIDLDLRAIGVTGDEPYEVHDLLTDARFEWRGGRNFVLLDPDVVPAHVFRVRHLAPDLPAAVL
ncbi:MAG TPA: alpha-1,4-glucan--maltose-1-phosphate maltosyltransferase [Acidimicrobiales bacterium]|jgi:starch synthase (maltosyl-transferring)|nr:alpha-1,4-glucan--maltose-1-phosphate maltosyltransferase [Acidimicrobiales bacterium]